MLRPRPYPLQLAHYSKVLLVVVVLGLVSDKVTATNDFSDLVDSVRLDTLLLAMGGM